MAAFIPSEEHIRHCMLFYYHAGFNATVATQKICDVYRDVLKVNKCGRWYRRFADGDFDLTDKPRSGRPTECDQDALKSLVDSDPRLSIEELSVRLGCTWSTIQRNLHEIGKSYRQGVWVPHELSEANKDHRRKLCISLLSRLHNDPFLDRIVTGDEKWILYDNMKRSKQWLSQGQCPVPTAKPNLSIRKRLLCVWWDYSGIIHYELRKPGETITAEIYCQQLQRLQSELLKKRASLVNRKSVILQHDNARPHAARITQEKIKELQWEVLPHPPYSPDLAPTDYHLFRSLEHSLRNKAFSSEEEVRKHLESYFASQTKEFFKRGIENLQEKWQCVADNNGEYFVA